MKRQTFEVRTAGGELIGIKYAWNAAKRLGESWVRNCMTGKTASMVDSKLTLNPETGKPLFTEGKFTWEDSTFERFTFCIVKLPMA